jgi:hypothetical protein
MAKTIPFRDVQSALSLWGHVEPVAPPSAAVIAAVLELGDLRVDCEDGRVSIRLSAARAALTDAVLRLGVERERALDVTLIWDVAEDEIVRVVDVAPLRAGHAAHRRRNAYAEARKRGVTFVTPMRADASLAQDPQAGHAIAA